jgi:hypothetical protein
MAFLVVIGFCPVYVNSLENKSSINIISKTISYNVFFFLFIKMSKQRSTVMRIEAYTNTSADRCCWRILLLRLHSHSTPKYETKGVSGRHSLMDATRPSRSALENFSLSSRGLSLLLQTALLPRGSKGVLDLIY